jgi:hypothetical protein
MLPTHAEADRAMPLVTDIERLAGAAFVVNSDSISLHADRESTAAYSRWAEFAADSVSRNQPAPPNPSLALLSQALPPIEPRALIAQCAIEQLASEVRHVASSMH